MSDDNRNIVQEDANNTEDSIRPILAELEAYRDGFIERYYGGKFPESVIVIGKMGRMNYTEEECPSDRVWKKANADSKDKGRYEIKIPATALASSKEHIAGVLLHEMVHCHCRAKGIQDTNKNGSYHNQKFMEQAVAHGLTMGDKDKRYGWSNTYLSEDTKAFLKDKFGDIEHERFLIYRALEEKKESETDKDKPKAPRLTRKYICEKCNRMLMSDDSAEGKLMCVDCNEPFITAKQYREKLRTVAKRDKEGGKKENTEV